jgi:hypothetical protein
MIELTQIEHRLPETHLREHLADVAADVAAATHFSRRSEPRRWRMVLFVLAAGALAAWAIARSDAVRTRSAGAIQKIRARASQAFMGQPLGGQLAEPSFDSPGELVPPVISDPLEGYGDHGPDGRRLGQDQAKVLEASI